MTVSTLTQEQAEFMKGVAEKHVEMIMDYECGDLDVYETIRLFCYLQRTRLAYKLQGHYGRVCQDLIAQQFFNEMGEPNIEHINFMLEIEE